jgi:hypothetical protein
MEQATEKTKTDATKLAAAEPRATLPSDAPRLSLHGQHRPVVVRVKSKKKKRKYSGGTKELQIDVRSVSKVAERIASALASGLSLYAKKTNKSSLKKKDGVLRDMLRNSASGLGMTLRKSSRIPVLLSKTASQRTVRRRARALARALGFFR